MKYSIILPVRNGGNYIKECIRSILCQTRDDFNCIILDNASSDGALEWISALKDSRITIYRSEKSLSIEENWARIKDVPKNEFMTMIGHDDLLHPFYLEEMDRLIARHPDASLYQTHFSFIDKDGKHIRNCLPMDERQSAAEFLACQFARTIESTGTGYMMRSADYDDAGGIPVDYPNLIFSDFELWVKLMCKGYKATASRNSFSYRVHASVSQVTNGMQFQLAFGKYVGYIQNLAAGDRTIMESVRGYGRDFLLYYCETLSHRLLKTPWKRRGLKVREFIRICEDYARDLIPGQEFRPMEVLRIRLASQIDSFFISRKLFYWLRRIPQK